MPTLTLKTNKRIGFWGAPAEVPPDIRLLSACLTACGANTGNLFIGAGLWNATEAPTKQYWNFYDRRPEEFDEQFDALFVPASNFIFEYTDLTDQFAFFSKTKAQIFMAGLGSQVRHGKQISIPKGTEYFLKLTAERSATIGVRGETTADILNQLGIKNVDVVGCPSMLDVPDSFTPVPDFSKPGISVAGNFSNGNREHSFSAEHMANVEKTLFEELVRKNGFYVLQNERHEIALRKALAFSDVFNEEEIWHINRVSELMSDNVERDTLLSFLRWRTRLFFDINEWLQFMRTVDFSFGTRFHGNVAALRAGRPTYILCHDNRTLELCRLYAIPHRIIDHKAKPATISELAEECDMSLYSKRYPQIQAAWISFVTKNGFEVAY